MPERVYSALRTGGTARVGEDERLAAQLAAQAQDAAFRQALLQQQGTQFDREFGDRTNQRAHEMALSGSFADRSRADLGLEQERGRSNLAIAQEGTRGQLGVAEMSTRPAMEALLLEREARAEGAPLRQAQNAGELQRLQFRNSLLSDLQGQEGGLLTPEDRRRATLFSIDPALAQPSADEQRRQRFEDLQVQQYLAGAQSPNPGVREESNRGLRQLGLLGAGTAAAYGQAVPDGAVDEALIPYLGASQVTPETLLPLLRQQLPEYINRDTEFSRSALGGLLTGGTSRLAAQGEPSQEDQDRIVSLYMQLVQAFAQQNGGDAELAKQQALSAIDEIAKTSNQGGDYRTDWDADATRALFGRF